MTSSSSAQIAIAERDQAKGKVYVFPAAHAQRSLWILHQLAPESPFYNLHSGIRIASALNVDALARAVNEIVRRHESLRTAFKAVDGEPVQLVSAKLDIELPVTDLRQMAESAREEEAYRIALEQALKPFDLEQWPPLRTSVLRLGDEEYVHLLTVHHIVCDNWSMNILMEELSALYRAYCDGQPSPLPELEIQYADYAEWEWQWLQGPLGTAHLSYWKNQLADLPALQLPTDWPRPEVSSFMGASFYFTLSEKLYRALVDLSQKENATLFMTMLAAFQTLLHRYTGQIDVAVGTPVANRNRFEFESVIGHFVNSLVLRSDLSGNPRFRELVARVRNTALDGYAHQDFPFEKLVHELRPERGAGHNPFFQVHFQLLNAPEGYLGADASPDELVGEAFEIEAGTAKFDLALDLWEYPDGLEAHIEYSTDLFSEETIARLAGHFQTLLKGIVADPDQRLSELPFVSRRERRQLLHDWNDTKSVYARDQCLHELFESQVERTPEAVAVVFRGEQLTYDVLNRRANQMAHHLCSLGVGPETVVAICAERSLDMIVGLLGILKAGGAYLPLDPSEPRDRLLHMLDEAQPSLLLTQQRLSESLGPIRQKQVYLDASMETLARCSDGNPTTEVSPRNLAYVIYTSGSSGRPKGVMVESQAVCNHLYWMQAAFPIVAADRILMKYPFNFDASICEIFGPLLAGAKLIVAEPSEHWDVAQFVEVLAEEQVTVLDVVPSMLEALLDEPGFASCRCLRRVTSGGEPLSAELRNRFFAQMDAELHNIYGPTEATIGTTSWTCRRGNMDDPVLVGRPGGNMKVYVLDAHLNPVPIGVPGEICIGGEGLARGYLNQPELTAERFIRNPFSDAPNGRMYRTGDLARYLPDGNLEYLGRLDDQVKVRGYRVEPGEIESTLAQHPSVRTCTVVPTAGNAGEHRRLVAYVVPVRSEPELWPSLGEYDVYDELLYYAMTHDAIRNRAYRAAIHEAVGGKIVLDIGTGADAILTRFCLESGAKHVFAIEADPDAYRNARTVVEDLALKDRVTLLQGDSTKLQLPERVDVCVSEILGTIGSSEGAVSILNDARRFLKDDGVMIPRRCVTLFAPVSLPENLVNSPRLSELPRAYVEQVFQKAGRPFDMRMCIKNFPDRNIIAPAQSFEELVFASFVCPEYEFQTRFTIDRASRLDGFLFWLRLYPGHSEPVDSLMSNMSWLPVFFPAFCPTQQVVEGDVIEARCTCRLTSDTRMPDYHISGTLFRNGREPFSFAHASPRHTTTFRQNAFYDSLFEGFADAGGQARRSDSGGSKPDATREGADERGLVPDLREFLRRRLPHFMVPSAFVVLDELPMTRSGKIDRGALLATAQKRPDPEQTYVAPRDDVEAALAKIWSELLGVERVGINDNFFDLGGDSILTIQIIARANQAGLRLRPAQLFQYQTIAELAAMAGSSLAVQADQGPLTGEAPLTPIQHWFFEQNFDDAHHYNQSFLMEAPRTVDAAKLSIVLDRLLMHHDALRLRFGRTELGWRQTFADDAASSLESFDLSALPAVERDTAFEKVATEMQTSLNLEAGPLLRAALIDIGDPRTIHLVVVIHHLVMDGVSWRIFAEDLWNAYDQVVAGGDIELPPKTTSFQVWSLRLTDYAQSTSLDLEIDHWRALARDSVCRLPVDFPEGENTAASARAVSVALGVEETRALLQDVPKFYRTQINDALLTALLRTVGHWTGNSSLLIDLEGHGRESVIDDADLSRTIGWFTAIAPVRLELGSANNPGDALRTVKEQLRAVPSRGMGFGLLRYLHRNVKLRDAMREIPSPEIAFNYMGQYGADRFESPQSRRLTELMGPNLSPRGHRPNLFELDGSVSEGRLQVAWTYSENVHRRSTVEKLAESFVDELRLLIANCGLPDAGGYTPSDFARARLSQRDLDKLISKLH
jgi:amino acid adenylation domain-containing protein/non-ribosomal peptide synthase protein (TIGR01720 family)